MNAKLPVLSFLLTMCAMLSAQQSQPAVVDAAALRVVTQPIQQRSFCIRFVGSQITNRTSLLGDLTALLTPNVGSIEYFASQQVLVAKDTVEVLDAVAAAIAKADVQPTQILLDIRFVKLTNPQDVVRALAGSGQSCQEGVAVLDAEQVKTVLLRLKEGHAGITQAPQLVALADQVASIFIGNNKRSARVLPDGGAATPLDPDSIDIAVTPSVQAGTGRVALNLQLRSLFTSLDGAVLSQSLLLASGQTAVLQKFAAADVGAMLFVTPCIIDESKKAKLPR